MEQAGIPTVAIVALGFEANARATARALGLPGLGIAIVEDCLTALSPEEVVQQVDLAMEQIVVGLTAPSDREYRLPGLSGTDGPARAESFEGSDPFDAFERMNAEFLDRGWGDGFPLWPPTPDRVCRMTRATRRDPQEVVAILEPGLGLATVEKIAVNAVMAGCEPAHLPVLLAAVEAISDPKYQLRFVATSTSPETPLLVVNGPIARTLGINAGRCALGPGKFSRVNTALGRAMRLILMNIAHAYPGSTDPDTIGSPAKYGMCLAENEQQNPWEPLHLERGYRAEESTVTVFSVKHQLEINDLVSSTPEGILTTYSASVALPGGEHMEDQRVRHHHLLLLAPDHARCIARAGWGKREIRDYVYQHATLPWRVLRNNQEDESIAAEWQWVMSLPPESPVPVVGSPDQYQIVVVGGPAGKSSYTHGDGQAITRLIEVS